MADVESEVSCLITSGVDGWFHVQIRTTAPTTEKAAALAEKFFRGIFPGKRRVVRVLPTAERYDSFDSDRVKIRGFARFSLQIDEDGPTEMLNSSAGGGFGLQPMPRNFR
jgi:hypothetical protein